MTTVSGHTAQNADPGPDTDPGRFESEASESRGQVQGRILLLPDQTGEDIAAPLAELVECLQRGPRTTCPTRPGLAQAVRQAARASFRLPEVLEEPVHQILSGSLQDIGTWKPKFGWSTDACPRTGGADEPPPDVPGLGPVFAEGILAEIGDIADFPDDDPG
ncbi:MAG: IS110 family transposase [Actinomycetia bacterium]|nr:IS110 family transposase [Actinomycetes bacterium]